MSHEAGFHTDPLHQLSTTAPANVAPGLRKGQPAQPHRRGRPSAKAFGPPCGNGQAGPMTTDAERVRLRQTFNQAAASYQRARPDYPAALFDDLIEAAGLTPGDRLLEVGCATGKATVPLARRGFRITCIELGADLAAEARRNLGSFPRVTIVNEAFETWEPPQAGFDLVYAATA